MIESFTDRNTMKRAHRGKAEGDDSESVADRKVAKRHAKDSDDDTELVADLDTELYTESDTDSDTGSDTESDTEKRKFRDLFSSLSLTSRLNNNCTSFF